MVRIPGCGTGSTNNVLTKHNFAGTALVYSTFLGGNNFNGIFAVAVDSAAQAYVAGTSNASCGPGPYYPNASNPNVITCQAYDNFPTTAGSAQDSTNTTVTNNNVAFLTKFNAAGGALLYSPILGNASPTPSSTSSPVANAVAIDPSGDAYIAGYSTSYLYTTSGSYQPTIGSLAGGHSFTGKFDTVGQKLLYSTFLTGSGGGDQAYGVAADFVGNAYVAGSTSTCTFPTRAGASKPREPTHLGPRRTVMQTSSAS